MTASGWACQVHDALWPVILWTCPVSSCRIEYAGTRYSGWQIQKNARTVQGEIDRAVARGHRRPRLRAVRVRPHRRRRPRPRPGRPSRRAHVAAAADACRPHQRPAARRHPRAGRHQGAASVPRPPRRAVAHATSTRSRAAARPLPSHSSGGSRTTCGSARCARPRASFTGRQDFRGFTDDDPEDKSTLVEVATVELVEDADALLLLVEGSHFLWKMVRRMTGVLVEVGRGGLEPRAVAQLLASPIGPAGTTDGPRLGAVSRPRRLSRRSAVGGAAARRAPRPRLTDPGGSRP